MSAIYRPKVPVKPMKDYILRDADKHVVVIAEPRVTSKGRVLLALNGGLLSFDHAKLLRNWLSDFIGHYEATAKGGVEEIEPEWLDDDNVGKIKAKPKITFRNLKPGSR